MTTADYRRIWDSKPVLRLVYREIHDRMLASRMPGPMLEIGAGIGNLKERLPDIVSVDLLEEPWIDAVADAHHLPFADGSLSNLFMFDVLHHLAYPIRFFDEAKRVLRTGGRLIFSEPAISPVSWVFYRYFHPEAIHMRSDPLDDNVAQSGPGAMDSNQALPTLIFGKYAETFAARLPEFATVRIEKFAFFAYPLSGGFRPWSLLPAASVRSVMRLENWLAPLLGRLMAFRMLVVLERIDADSNP